MSLLYTNNKDQDIVQMIAAEVSLRQRDGAPTPQKDAPDRAGGCIGLAVQFDVECV